MLPDHLLSHIRANLAGILGKTIMIRSHKPVHGGDINQACKLETSHGDYFLKYNNASRYPGMFSSEALGLALLMEAGEIKVPTVIGKGEAKNDAYLLLEFIDPAPQKEDFWENFGSCLARLHKHTADLFGLGHDNYIGSLVQINKRHQDWVSFFIHERLQRQAKLARDHGLIGSGAIKRLEKLYAELHNIFPTEPPALIHGDLWSGNYMTGPLGQAMIIDPAVYYGHREMDIGMSRLFGTFSEAFYDSYHREYPLEPGWRNRLDICNLYPLMVHVNLFGGTYVSSVERILGRF